jgi:hypothetical protein
MLNLRASHVDLVLSNKSGAKPWDSADAGLADMMTEQSTV